MYRSSSWRPTSVACGPLSGQDAHRSAAHQMGNRLAYDRLMIQTCEMLEIEHELDGDSIGLDRDIERFRVEAELERAGVVLYRPPLRPSGLITVLSPARYRA